MSQKAEQIYVAIGLDFETGGLDCSKHACTEISLQAVRLDTWEITDRYVQYFYPYHRQECDKMKRKVLKSKHELELEANTLMEYQEVALTYSAISMDMLYQSGIDVKQIAWDVLQFAQKNTLSKGKQMLPFLIGQNTPFDIGFLQQIMNYADLVTEFEKTFAGNKDFYGNFQPHYIDTIRLGQLCFAHDPSVTSYKLELIAEKLHIDLNDAHDADADVTATLNAAMIYSNKMRNGSGSECPGLQKQEKTRNHFKI